MRWFKKESYNEDKRTVRRFLLWPLCLNGECRWLEWAWIAQEYLSNYGGSGWDDIAFVDGPERIPCMHGYEEWNDCPVCGH